MEFRKVAYLEESYWGVPGRWWLPGSWREVTSQPRIQALDSIYWTQVAREAWERNEGKRAWDQ